VLDAEASGPRTFVLRYACARGNGGVSLRVKRGAELVLQRENLALPATKEWTAWSWFELPLGEIPAGRYHVELYGANGCTDLDVMGWKPTVKSAK
jgi:hypothetical protein